MADLSWAASMTVGGGGGGGTGGNGITSLEIDGEGNLVAHYEDGKIVTVGKVAGETGKVYVPHVDQDNVLTFIREDDPGKAPDPVDLDASSEWGDIGADAQAATPLWGEI